MWGATPCIKDCVPALRSDQPNSHRYRPATMKLRPRGLTALIDRGHAKSGSRSGIPPSVAVQRELEEGKSQVYRFQPECSDCNTTAIIPIEGHFSVHGMPDRPCVISFVRFHVVRIFRTRPWSPSRVCPLRGI